MAEIVQNAPVAETSSFIERAFSFLAQFWWVFLLFAIIIGLIILAYYIFKKKEDNDRRRDSAVYATAMNLFEACDINKNAQWVRKQYSLWNLLWLGIPFKWREHSVRIVDIDRNFFGWYRGHTKTQGGDTVFKFYKNKIFFFFEEELLLFCPAKYVIKDAKGARTFVSLPNDTIRFDVENANEIRIKCSSITKQGNYYLFPNYVLVRNDEKIHLDLTDHISESIAKTNYLVQVENAYSDMSRAMGRAIEINPALRYEQKSPEKEKEVETQVDPGAS